MARRRIIKFEGHIKAWGLSYLKRNHWKIAAICEREELEQEAYLVFLTVRRMHPEIPNPAEFLRFYKVKMHFHVQMKAAACFPNPYNASTNPAGSCISLTGLVNGEDMLERIDAFSSCISDDVGDYLDLLNRMPDELRDVCAALFREALGIAPIPAWIRRRLYQRSTLEPVNSALCRLFGLDPKRDLFEEIHQAALNLERRSTTVVLSVEKEVTKASGVKRKSGEDEQSFLKRVTEVLDDWDDEDFQKLSADARKWHDKAVLAMQEDEEIPTFLAAKEEDAEKEAEEEEDEAEAEEEDTEEEDAEEDEAEEEKPKAAKGKKAKAATDDEKPGKRKASEKKTTGDGKARGRSAKITDDMKIRVLEGARERAAKAKDGKGLFKRFLLYKDGMTVGEFMKKEGANKSNFLWHVQKGWISLEK